MLFNMEFGISFGPRVLQLARFFIHTLSIIWSTYVCGGFFCSFFFIVWQSRSYHGYFITSQMHCLGLSCWYRQMGWYSLLLMVCYTWISFAISFGFVRIILCLSMRQCSVGILMVFKTFLLIFLRIFWYNCWYNYFYYWDYLYIFLDMRWYISRCFF